MVRWVCVYLQVEGSPHSVALRQVVDWGRYWQFDEQHGSIELHHKISTMRVRVYQVLMLLATELHV